MPFHRFGILLLTLLGLAAPAAAFEGCNFSFRIDTQSSAFQALIEGASERGGFWRPIGEAPDDVRQIAQFIGRLDVCLMTPDGKPRTVTVGGQTRTLQSPQLTTCTAALLAGNRLLTNNHCFYNDVMVEAGFTFVQEARINFGYTSADFTGDVKTYAVSTREVARDFDHDALVLQIVGADANETLGGHVPMVMETQARPRRALTMIHHPNGDPQQFSSGTCQVHPEQARLPEGVSQLRHSCETTGGSSGALLLDARTLAVVGLHNQGGLHRRGGYNGGHRIAAVEAALGLGFEERRGPEPKVDPETEAQAALTDALAIKALDARQAALEAVMARFPDSRAAASARFTLDLLMPEVDPETEAQAALTEALQANGPDARRAALRAVMDDFPTSRAGASARFTLQLLDPKVDPEAEAQDALTEALQADGLEARRRALQRLMRDFPESRAAVSARSTLEILAPREADPESAAQAALASALRVQDEDERKAGLRTVIRKFPDGPAAASARNALDLMEQVAKTGPREAQARAALDHALSLTHPKAQEMALERVWIDFRETQAARDARLIAAGVEPSSVVTGPDGDPKAQAALEHALSLTNGNAKGWALRQLAQDFPGTQEAEKALAALSGTAVAAPVKGRFGMTLTPASRLIKRVNNITHPSAGVLITQVDPASTAARAGLASGDVITFVHVSVVGSPFEFDRAITRLRSSRSRSTTVTAVRSGRKFMVDLPL